MSIRYSVNIIHVLKAENRFYAILVWPTTFFTRKNFCKGGDICIIWAPAHLCLQTLLAQTTNQLCIKIRMNWISKIHRRAVVQAPHVGRQEEDNGEGGPDFENLGHHGGREDVSIFENLRHPCHWRHNLLGLEKGGKESSTFGLLDSRQGFNLRGFWPRWLLGGF